jgi:hypothetical protein
LVLSIGLASAQGTPSYFVDFGLIEANLASHTSSHVRLDYFNRYLIPSPFEYSVAGGLLFRPHRNFQWGTRLSYQYSEFEFKDAREVEKHINHDVYYASTWRHNSILEIIASLNSEFEKHKRRKSHWGFFSELGAGVGYNWVYNEGKYLKGQGYWHPFVSSYPGGFNLQIRGEMGIYFRLNPKSNSTSTLRLGFPFYWRRYIDSKVPSIEPFYQIGWFRLAYHFG